MVDEMAELFVITAHPLDMVLSTLLKDQTTGESIIFATDAYEGMEPTDHIREEMFFSDNPVVIQPRSFKSLQEQQKRTRHMAEVFTPTWLCNRMNNYLDEQWFGRADVFNRELPDNQWETVEGDIVFPEGRNWHDDRKLRIVGEHTKTAKTWTTWAVKAIQSCYGFEFQGDSLLIARINVLLSFCEYHMDLWGKMPSDEDISLVAEIASWNLWQMDGFTDAPPLGKPEEVNEQPDLFDFDEPEETTVPLSHIKDWAKDRTFTYKAIKEGV